MVTASLMGYISLLIFIIIPIAIILFIYKAFKRSEQRAEEKLNIEKQQTINLQKRVDEMNGRLVVIEKMLREVE